MFPGVTLPFGVVKIGVDVQPPSGTGDPYSGFHPLGKVTGFSLMHESGTGGAPKYGTVSQLPVVGALENPLADQSVERLTVDQASVGIYKTSLANGVNTQLTASQHTGMLRHTFSNATDEVHVLVDVSHFLPSFRGQGIEQHYVEGSIEVDTDGTYKGFGVYNGGWNLGNLFPLHFIGFCFIFCFFDLRVFKARTGKYFSAVPLIPCRHGSGHSLELVLPAKY